MPRNNIPAAGAPFENAFRVLYPGKLMFEQGKDRLKATHAVLTLVRFFVCAWSWRDLNLYSVGRKPFRFPIVRPQ